MGWGFAQPTPLPIRLERWVICLQSRGPTLTLAAFPSKLWVSWLRPFRSLGLVHFDVAVPVAGQLTEWKIDTSEGRTY